MIQYWDPVTFDFNKKNKKIKFEYKVDTDLYELVSFINIPGNSGTNLFILEQNRPIGI